jgi:hypothetical protein
MMLRTAILATTALLALGVTSCSGSPPPPAQGDMTIHISSASSPPAGKTCNVGAHSATIGDNPPSDSNPGSRVRDGNKGAYVNCKVKGKTVFNVSGSMRKGTVSFQVIGSVPKVGGGDGTATITSYDPTTAFTMTSPADPQCTVTPIEIAGGRIWASFACPGFVNTDSPSTYCKADGYFVFENCDQ